MKLTVNCAKYGTKDLSKTLVYAKVKNGTKYTSVKNDCSLLA